MTKRYNLNDAERKTLTHCVEVALRQFIADKDMFATMQPIGPATAEATQRMRDAFTQYAHDAAKLLDKLTEPQPDVIALERFVD
jgi:hypothetical protein